MVIGVALARCVALLLLVGREPKIIYDLLEEHARPMLYGDQHATCKVCNSN